MIASQHSHREVISCYHELTSCIVSEKNWDTKGDKGKCVLFVHTAAGKDTSWDKEMSNSEEIKPSIVELCLVGDTSQSVSQSASIKFC